VLKSRQLTRGARRESIRPMSAAASSSTSPERDERVFIAAFGIMDSHQDGEAVAAFMRVRAILRRHGGGFRRMLERSHEAERLNDELGRQNAQLLRENTALRARDSRPAPPRPGDVRRPFVMPAIPGSRHWDVGLIGIIAISTAYGLLGVTVSLTLIAAILVVAAFANWFSPIRFLVGVLLGLAALGMVVSNPSASADVPALAVADAPTAVTPTTPSHSATDAAPQREMFTEASPPPQAFADLPPRRTSSEPRSRHATTARIHCGPYRLQPGFTCPRSNLWRRSSFPDFRPPPNVRYD
jgi:hypothetical protein